MKICDQYSHLDALQLLHRDVETLSELMSVVNAPNAIFGETRPYEIKRLISVKFNDLGWADKVRVGTSKLTISFLKNRVGICFQLGNVARTYADILKLMQLHRRGTIDVGVIYVPHKIESLKMGANYAQYNRLAKEINQFQDIISIPILIIGLSN